MSAYCFVHLLVCFETHSIDRIMRKRTRNTTKYFIMEIYICSIVLILSTTWRRKWWCVWRILSNSGFTWELVLLDLLSVPLYFFFWPLCSLFFFDIRILIAPLVSSNSSYFFSISYYTCVVLSIRIELSPFNWYLKHSVICQQQLSCMA